MVLVFLCAVEIGRLVAPTSPHWQGRGTPWERIERAARRVRRLGTAALLAAWAFGYMIPVSWTPKGHGSSPMSVGGITFIGILASAVVIGGMSYLVAALTRLHHSSKELQAENASLREDTEGLV